MISIFTQFVTYQLFERAVYFCGFLVGEQLFLMQIALWVVTGVILCVQFTYIWLLLWSLRAWFRSQFPLFRRPFQFRQVDRSNMALLTLHFSYFAIANIILVEKKKHLDISFVWLHFVDTWTWPIVCCCHSILLCVAKNARWLLMATDIVMQINK